MTHPGARPIGMPENATAPRRSSRASPDVGTRRGTDGTTLHCHTTSRWDHWVTPGQQSPTCGHRYQNKPTNGTTYPITTTSDWTITWTALGQTGTIPLTRTSPTRHLEVGELVSVITKQGVN